MIYYPLHNCSRFLFIFRQIFDISFKIVLFTHKIQVFMHSRIINFAYMQIVLLDQTISVLKLSKSGKIFPVNIFIILKVVFSTNFYHLCETTALYSQLMISSRSPRKSGLTLKTIVKLTDSFLEFSRCYQVAITKKLKLLPNEKKQLKKVYKLQQCADNFVMSVIVITIGL